MVPLCEENPVGSKEHRLDKGAKTRDHIIIVEFKLVISCGLLSSDNRSFEVDTWSAFTGAEAKQTNGGQGDSCTVKDPGPTSIS